MIISKETQDKKVVVFTLIKDKLNMTDMLELGYCRDEITSLFKALAEKSFGQHIPGRKGRNGTEKFIPNDLCPESFEMVFNKRPKSNKVEEVKVIPNTDAVYAEFLSMERRPNNKLPSTDKAGYVISFSVDDNFIILDRLADGGFSSIEDAVESVWDRIENKVQTYECKHMSKIEQVASSLRGKGYIELNV